MCVYFFVRKHVLRTKLSKLGYSVIMAKFAMVFITEDVNARRIAGRYEPGCIILCCSSCTCTFSEN